MLTLPAQSVLVHYIENNGGIQLVPAVLAGTATVSPLAILPVDVLKPTQMSATTGVFVLLLLLLFSAHSLA